MDSSARRRRPHPARRARRIVGAGSTVALVGLGGVLAAQGAPTTTIVTSDPGVEAEVDAPASATLTQPTTATSAQSTPVTSTHGS